MNFFLKAFIWDLAITLLFVLLVPGVLLTLPTKGLFEGYGSAEMNVIATHAAVFFVAYYIIKVICWGIKKVLPRIRRKKVVALATTTPPSTPTATTTTSSSSAKKTTERFEQEQDEHYSNGESFNQEDNLVEHMSPKLMKYYEAIERSKSKKKK